MSSYEQAKALFDQGRLRECADLLARLLKVNPSDARALQLQGVLQYQSGFAKAGKRMVERALEIDPGCGEAWHSYGLMHHMEGDNESALDAFLQATLASPQLADGWKHRGYIHQLAQEHQAALPLLQKALEIGGAIADVHFFLGNSFAALGQHDQAIEQFEEAVRLAPTFGDAWNNLANSLLQMRLPERALDAANKARRMGGGEQPIVTEALALQMLGRHEESLKLLDSIRNPSTDVALTAAMALRELDRLPQAASRCLEAREVATAVRLLQEDGRWEEAIGQAPRGSMQRAVVLPTILGSVEAARSHMSEALDEVEEIGDPLNRVGISTFFLAYHGVGERALQEKVAKTYLAYSEPLRFRASHSPKGSRIRVGVLSGFGRDHTIGKLFAQLFERLDRTQFETVLLQGGSVRFADLKHTHYLAPDLRTAQQQIAGQELDILVWPEVGMDLLAYYLSFSRFAPVQVCLWGHPMSTGSPTIDYFLSSEHLEREGGEGEYSERLVRLPSANTYFSRPPVPSSRNRTTLGLPEKRRLYGCPQTLFKFHPDFDRVLSSILADDGDAVLVMLEPKRRHWKELIMQRWARTYPALCDRSIWLAPLALPDYLRVGQLCDAVLDPIQFGGGNSSLEFFASGTPIVTLPGGLLRNRITYAAYRAMDVAELIATDEDDYVRLALQLARDSDFKAVISGRIKGAGEAIFERQAAVDEFAQWLRAVAP